MVIYKTTNLITGKIYVGKNSHNNPAYFGSGKLIRKALREFGLCNFKKEILEVCSSASALNEREIFWIKYFDAQNPDIGYNISSGGEGALGPFSEEHKKHLSESTMGRVPWNKGLKGFTHTKETRRRLSLSHKGHTPWNKGLRGVQPAWNKGLIGVVKQSEEFKTRQSEICKKHNFQRLFNGYADKHGLSSAAA